MQVKNKQLFDLNGNPIKAGDVELTVAVVLVNCALAPTADGRPRAATDVASRYDLAIRLNKLALDESIEIAVDLMSRLKEDVLRVYATIVAGQMLPIMDGSTTH